MRAPIIVIAAGGILAAVLVLGADRLGVIHLGHPVSSQADNKAEITGNTRARPPNPDLPPDAGGSTAATAPRQEIQPPTGGAPPVVSQPRAGAPDAPAQRLDQAERGGAPGRVSPDVAVPSSPPAPPPPGATPQSGGATDPRPGERR